MFASKTNKMADANKPLTFILSDESINSYGTRIITSGIDLSLFKRNPIMLWNHFRTWSGKTDEVLPIGRWDNIRKEDNKLMADAVFDEQDEFAQKIKSKVEQGIINMASIGINIIVTSEDKSVLLPGQTRPTVLKSLIREASVCDIASNRNALRLYDDDGSEINFSDNSNNHLLPLLTTLDKQNQNDTNMNLSEQLASVLGLKETPTETLLLSHIKALADENATFKQAEIDRKKSERDIYLKDAVKARKITANQVAQYEKLYDADPDSTRAIVDNLPAAVDLSEGSDKGSGEKPYEAGSAWNEKFRKTGQID